MPSMPLHCLPRLQGLKLLLATATCCCGPHPPPCPPAGQGTITAPGCIAATPIEVPLDITEGCSALDMPLVYFFGHTTPTDNPELYKVGFYGGTGPGV